MSGGARSLCLSHRALRPLTGPLVNRELNDLRQRRLPSLHEMRSRRHNVRNYPVDQQGALFREDVVDLATLGLKGRNYYNRSDNPPYHASIPGSLPGLYLRRSAAERLRQVNARLATMGLGLFVHDGLRPIEVQRYFHDVWMPARVREKHPDWTDAQVIEETERFWAKPSVDDNSPAPHATGGATDLTLQSLASGEHLYMGSIFDDVTEIAYTDHFEQDGNVHGFSDQEAQANRRVLYWTMTEAGFVNYFNEWWHFSWGDQMWAKISGVPAAHYGIAPIPGR